MARPLRVLLATLAVPLALLIAPLTGAAAEALPVPEPTASEATGEAEPAPMSLEFTHRRASLVGARALVFVRCGGIVAETCEGTLVLSGLGGAHKVPYLIDRGERQALAVPLGDNEDAVDRGSRARVVARTLQLSGGTVRTSSVLRVG